MRSDAMALLVTLAAHHFGSDWRNSGHASDTVKRSKMTDAVEKGLVIFGEQ